MGAFRKGLTLSLGSIISTQVNLHSVIPSSERSSGMNRLCPDHHLKLHQAHECPGPDGKAHFVHEYVLGLDTADGWLIPEPSEKPEVETAKVLELTPMPADHLDNHTFYGDMMYYAAPSTVATLQGWQVITDMVSKGKVALVAKGSLRKGSNERMFRLTVFRGCLVLRELVWPASINDAPEVSPVKITPAITRMVNEFVSGLMSDWEHFDRTNTTQAQVEQWIASGKLVPKADEVQPVESGAPVQVVDLMEALKAATGRTK